MDCVTNDIGQTLKIGDSVRLEYDRLTKGTIYRFAEEGVYLHFEGEDEEDGPHDVDELRLYNPDLDKTKALFIQNKINDAKNAFEKAFALWEEAQKLADSTMNTDISDLKYEGLLDMREFENVVTSSGWISSGARGLYC